MVNFIPNDKELFIEVKTGPEIIEYLPKAIYQYKEKIKKISIISFYPNVIKEIKYKEPKLTANLLINFEALK